MLPVGITDVVEMEAVDRILAGDLQHAFQLQLPVLRMRRAEPIGRLALDRNLGAAFAASLLDKILRRSAQIEVDFPDVDLDAVPLGRGTALLDLVAVTPEVALRGSTSLA